MEESERGGFKDECEEGVHQSTCTMAIINHQLCYFLSGDYLGEERLRDGRGRAEVIRVGRKWSGCWASGIG